MTAASRGFPFALVSGHDRSPLGIPERRGVAKVRELEKALSLGGAFGIQMEYADGGLLRRLTGCRFKPHGKVPLP